jgi:hypothetical protein
MSEQNKSDSPKMETIFSWLGPYYCAYWLGGFFAFIFTIIMLIGAASHRLPVTESELGKEYLGCTVSFGEMNYAKRLKDIMPRLSEHATYAEKKNSDGITQTCKWETTSSGVPVTYELHKTWQALGGKKLIRTSLLVDYAGELNSLGETKSDFAPGLSRGVHIGDDLSLIGGRFGRPTRKVEGKDSTTLTYEKDGSSIAFVIKGDNDRVYGIEIAVVDEVGKT